MEPTITATIWMRNPVLDILKAAEELAAKTPIQQQFAAALDAAHVQKLWTSLPATRELIEYAAGRSSEIREALAAESESADDKDVRAAARKMLALFDGYVRWTADAMEQIEKKERLAATLHDIDVLDEATADEPIGDSPAAAELSKPSRRRKAAAAA
jgi:hypothetical protein